MRPSLPFSMTGIVSIMRLSAAHDRRTFSCGTPLLDRYLREHAGQDERRRFANCFVAVGENARIAGYYTLSATSVLSVEMPAEISTRLPRYPSVPAALIGRLAIDTAFQGKGLGHALLVDAVHRSLRAEPAIFAIVVEAKDDRAVSFYRHYQFQSLAARPMTLFLPVTFFAKLHGLSP